MAYIELHQAVFDHRKTIEVADSLDLPEVYVVGHLAALWAWAIDNCQSGVLPSSHRVIARGARWPGDPNLFVTSLITSGYVDQTLDGLLIHDWPDYGGKLIAKRQANAAKQARYRERQEGSELRNQSVTDTLPSRYPLEKSRVEKSRVEKNISPPTPSPGEPTTPKPKTIKTPVPDNFIDQIPVGVVQDMSDEQGMSLAEIGFETGKMVDYYRSKGERRVDWVAAWRNWMRSDYRKPRGSPPTGNGKPRGMTNEEILAYGRGEYGEQRRDGEDVVDVAGRVVKRGDHPGEDRGLSLVAR
jgi:hypothetical protein